jgi:nucleoid-associated protein YgaU
VDPDGQTVIAGHAAPNERVEVLLDGHVVETMLADASGRFVAVLAAPPSPTPRELRLRVMRPEPPPGGQIRGVGEAPAGEGAKRGETASGDASPAAAGRARSAAGEQGAPSPSEPPHRIRGLEAATAPKRPADAGGADPALPQAPPGRAAGGRFLLGEPVIILPSGQRGAAPALVQAQGDGLAMLQPGGPPADGVVLDQLTQQPDGNLLLRGRARPGHAVRVYGNGQAIDTVAVADGGWSLALPAARAQNIRLFRLDEIGRAGAVASRIEVPFEPSDATRQVVRDRRITVQRGDNLWRIAEAHYGEGIRYSLIFGANGDLIRDPDLIYPDQVFTVPQLVEAR